LLAFWVYLFGYGIFLLAIDFSYVTSFIVILVYL